MFSTGDKTVCSKPVIFWSWHESNKSVNETKHIFIQHQDLAALGSDVEIYKSCNTNYVHRG